MEKFYLSHRELSPIYPEAKPFRSFGLNFVYPEATLSVGTYFKKNGMFLYNTISPFDFDRVEYLEDLDIIVLHSFQYNLSLRLYFVDYKTISSIFWNALDSGKGISSGDLICKSGEYFTPYRSSLTYVEMYANSSDSLLFKLFPEFHENYTEDFLQSLCEIHNTENCDIEKIKKKESIFSMNSFCIQKFDSILNQVIPFFSYQALLHL